MDNFRQDHVAVGVRRQTFPFFLNLRISILLGKTGDFFLRAQVHFVLHHVLQIRSGDSNLFFINNLINALHVNLHAESPNQIWKDEI